MIFVLFVVKIRYLQSGQTDLLLNLNQRRQLPMTIAIILGTRPEIIKMAPVIQRPHRKAGMKVLDVATSVAGGSASHRAASSLWAKGDREHLHQG